MTHARNPKDTSIPESAEERIAFLENENRRGVKALHLLTSMQELCAFSRSPRTMVEVVSFTREQIGRLDLFRATAFVMGDGKDLDFKIEDCTPVDLQQFLEAEIELHKVNGKWDYALQVDHAVITAGLTTRDSMVFHTVATRQKILGMFVGIVNDSNASPSDPALNLLSTILSVTANALENSYSYRKMDELLRARTEELEKARSESQSATVAKDQFLANMSHEIRTPMNGIVGLAELLLDSNLTTAQRDYVETIQSSGEALLTIISDILDFSKIAAKELQLDISDFNVGKTIDEIITLVSHKACAKKIEIIRIVQTGVPEIVQGDPKRLRQILAHLAGNAVKFTNAGTITIRCCVESLTDTHTTLRFGVSDTGIGISETERNKLFQPFTQIDGSSTRKYGGIGLGIALCKDLSELMGGNMKVESVLGKGSTFYFTAVFALPSKELAFGMVSSASGSEKVNDVLPVDLKILLVEDNPVNQKVALRMLDKLGNAASLAGNGREAVEAVTRERFDIVLMDCMMPELDGFEATKQIRVLRIEQPVIIAMTAGILRSEKDLCYTVGMDDYLAKPVKFNSLSSTIRKWATKKQNDTREFDAPSIEQKTAGSHSKIVRDEFILLLDQGRLAELRGVSDGDDSLLHELVEMFVRDGTERLGALRDALRGGDAYSLSQIAHALKGSARNIGTMKLAELCQTLEHSPNAGTLTNVGDLVDAIELEFHAVKKIFEQLTMAERSE